MNEARVKKNDVLIGQMERLAAIHDMVLKVQPGMSAPTPYDGNDIRNAIASLAKEIGTAPIEVPF